MPTPQEYLGDSQIQYQSPGLRARGAVVKVQGLVTTSFEVGGGGVGWGGVDSKYQNFLSNYSYEQQIYFLCWHGCSLCGCLLDLSDY